MMLRYFGEHASGPCGNCDTCLTPPEAHDGTVAAQMLLSAIYRLARERHQQFGAGHVIDILTGSATERVTQFRHDSLTVFGVGKETDAARWRSVTRQLLAQGLLAVEGDYGTLILTDASNDVLFRGRKVQLRSDPPREPRASRAKAAKSRTAAGEAVPATAAAELPPEALAIFDKLRSWRAGAAREQSVPAYVIFHDATLRQIAARPPSDLRDLSGVSGVGEAKLARYGQQILELLATASAAPASPAP
jgi:ATP-dependent DNA helicase RecQ